VTSTFERDSNGRAGKAVGLHVDRCLAVSSSATMAAIAPPLGEKQTAISAVSGELKGTAN
jgi:hypothetical protein